MRPLSLAERALDQPTVSLGTLLQSPASTVNGQTAVTLRDYTEETLRSGFPAIRQAPPRARGLALDGYIRRLVEYDFQELGVSVRRPRALMAWLRAYAAATSQTASYNTILRAAVQHPEDVPSRQTAAAYSEHLARLWMLDPTPGWLPTRNPFRRLGQAEKHSLADPALAARLLGVGPEALLAGTPSTMAQPRHAGLLGALFESLVGLSLKTYAQASEASVFHLRTQGGEHEIDFIVERPDHRVLAFEVKVTGAVEDRACAISIGSRTI